MTPVLDRNIEAYAWAPSTTAVAASAGIDPVHVLRFDANVPARPLAFCRPETVAGALSEVNTYPHGGYPELIDAITRYNGVSPDSIVLGAGCDDLILLVARSFAGPGDRIAIAEEPTYPLYRIAADIAGADVAVGDLGRDDTAITFCCRPNNPTGALKPLPDARPIAVDEAYYEYAGESAIDQIESGVIVLRTFSKAFGLAGARIGYALADPEIADELNRRQAPAPISTISATLAIQALENPPDIAPELEERERLLQQLQSLGLDVLPSRTNFVMVLHEDGDLLAGLLVQRGLVVRPVKGGIRITVRNQADDDVLLQAIAQALDDAN